MSIGVAHFGVTTSLHTLIPLHSLSPPSNLCGLPDDRPDFTWAQAINVLTLDFNQAICLRAGTAFAALADSIKRFTIGMGGSNALTVYPSASIPPRKMSLLTTQGLCLNCCDELLQIYHLPSSFLSCSLVTLSFIIHQISHHIHVHLCLSTCFLVKKNLHIVCPNLAQLSN